MVDYEKLMKKCFILAKKGQGKTSPNPLVGCIVLDKNDNIISTGYHHKYGDNHAERDALLKLKHGEEENGTLVVNLEPCSHFGKTPPCVDLIIERKIKKVVISNFDTNPKVDGISKLKNAGIEVVSNVLEKEGEKLNEIFFKNMAEYKPFIALKTATTIDGKIATNIGDSKWITSIKSRDYSKKLRTYYDCILTSSSTILKDDPEMKHSVKVILDRNLKTDLNSKFYKHGQIYLFTSKKTNVLKSSVSSNITLFKVSEKENKLVLSEIIDKLYELGIKSIFVEAGGKLLGDFMKNNLVDKIYHFIAPKIVNDNSALSCFDGDNISHIIDSKEFKFDKIKKFDNDILVIYSR